MAELVGCCKATVVLVFRKRRRGSPVAAVVRLGYQATGVPGVPGSFAPNVGTPIFDL